MSVRFDVPERTVQQRLDALQSGNVVRCHRARIKEGIVDGSLAPDHFLRRARTDPLLATMKVRDALAATPTFGPERAQKVLRWARVAPTKTLGGMSSEQYGRLLQVIEDSCAPLMRRCWEWERERR